MKTALSMRVIFSTFLLLSQAKTTEGSHVAYRNGSGRTRSTSCRILIFRQESGKTRSSRGSEPNRNEPTGLLYQSLLQGYLNSNTAIDSDDADDVSNEDSISSAENTTGPDCEKMAGIGYIFIFILC